MIERSDLIVQIVDCRHPLMFRSPDLEKYVKEVSLLKQNLILVNKADLLSPEQRKVWAEYFAKENIKFAFFSAITEDLEAISEELESVSVTEGDVGDNVESGVSENQEEDITSDVVVSDSSADTNDVLTSTQLLQLFRYLTIQFGINVTIMTFNQILQASRV